MAIKIFIVFRLFKIEKKNFIVFKLKSTAIFVVFKLKLIAFLTILKFMSFIIYIVFGLLKIEWIILIVIELKSIEIFIVFIIIKLEFQKWGKKSPCCSELSEVFMNLSFWEFENLSSSHKWKTIVIFVVF